MATHYRLREHHPTTATRAGCTNGPGASLWGKVPMARSGANPACDSIVTPLTDQQAQIRAVTTSPPMATQAPWPSPRHPSKASPMTSRCSFQCTYVPCTVVLNQLSAQALTGKHLAHRVRFGTSAESPCSILDRPLLGFRWPPTEYVQYIPRLRCLPS